MVQKVFCFLPQADLVPEHACVYFLIRFRDQGLISPGQTGAVVCEDCCCCCLWATHVGVLTARTMASLEVFFFPADFFSKDDYVMPCSNTF